MPPHRAPAAPAGEWESAVRDAGLRMTEPRRRVLQALEELGHATPDALVGHLAGRHQAMPASTVYRNLDSLAGAGLVRHSHMHDGAPAYHLPTHGHHLHLVCRGCGEVVEADPELARDLARNLLHAHGFDADVTHMAIDGHCRRCRPTDEEEQR